jgi:predicted DNA-binding transcriptional regulator YafY
MHMADIPHVDATAIFPPLTGNEARVLQVLTSDSARELSAEMIAEQTGLSPQQAQRALGSLRSRRPPLVDASPTNGVARAWQPARYSVAVARI